MQDAQENCFRVKDFEARVNIVRKREEHIANGFSNSSRLPDDRDPFVSIFSQVEFHLAATCRFDHYTVSLVSPRKDSCAYRLKCEKKRESKRKKDDLETIVAP